MRNTVPASATAIIVAFALLGVGNCGGRSEEAAESGDAEQVGQLESGEQVEGAAEGDEAGEHAEGGERGEHDEGGERGEGEHGEGGEGREHAEGGEHAGGDQHGEGGEEGEESGEYIGRADSWDATRRGIRLTLAFDEERAAFIGTVENTTEGTVCAVRVEVHLAGGPELGPTERQDLGPGESAAVELSAGDEGFESWTAHPETSACGTR
ncbi:MAG: hypothetical protein F4139_11345 [Gemmatimonadetes bacterium]|nr:hypothetical protein [Gemmatimonadota bacterium]MYK65941.1 hypothetical protein [Gemmatimonadota bacterium]